MYVSSLWGRQGTFCCAFSLIPSRFCFDTPLIFGSCVRCGRLRLYRSTSELAVTHWDISPASVMWLHWSTVCPGVFYVVDSNSIIHMWNLLVTDKVRGTALGL